MSIVRLIVATRNGGPPASQPVIKEMLCSVACGTLYIISAVQGISFSNLIINKFLCLESPIWWHFWKLCSRNCCQKFGNLIQPEGGKKNGQFRLHSSTVFLSLFHSRSVRKPTLGLDDARSSKCFSNTHVVEKIINFKNIAVTHASEC
jgi:hypothetical protein